MQKNQRISYAFVDDVKNLERIDEIAQGMAQDREVARKRKTLDRSEAYQLKVSKRVE